MKLLYSAVFKAGSTVADGSGPVMMTAAAEKRLNLPARYFFRLSCAFDGPFPLDAEMRCKLEQSSRFLPPTAHAHIKDGVTGTAWIEPSEAGL